MTSSTQFINERKTCAVCMGRTLSVLIDLPRLPLTDTFTRQVPDRLGEGIDQRVLMCGTCGHVQLHRQIDPVALYGTQYHYRTSISASARNGTEVFRKFLCEVAGDRQFECVLDVGCNDTYLLQMLSSRVRCRIGVDPIWTGREGEIGDRGIRVIGASVEAVNLSEALPMKVDLFVCRHTMEHIYDPMEMMRRLMSVATDDALFVFEVPGLDVLVGRIRFDQIFHQHLQYFSWSSLRAMLSLLDAVPLGHSCNYNAWGAFLFAFSRRGCVAGSLALPAGNPDFVAIQNRYRLFQEYTGATGRICEMLRGESVYGYGAAQMLPVLAYHLKTDFSFLKAVVDDDPAKDGMGYSNLPLSIVSPANVVDLAESTVIITAVDNFDTVIKRLLNWRPSRIVCPVPLM